MFLLYFILFAKLDFFVFNVSRVEVVIDFELPYYPLEARGSLKRLWTNADLMDNTPQKLISNLMELQ
jgi:hypothetical protein